MLDAPKMLESARKMLSRGFDAAQVASSSTFPLELVPPWRNRGAEA
jgi:hypothetical protein